MSAMPPVCTDAAAAPTAEGAAPSSGSVAEDAPGRGGEAAHGPLRKDPGGAAVQRSVRIR